MQRLEESMTTERRFVPIMEEEALRILKKPIDTLIADVTGSHIAIGSLRRYADGYCLQGGNDQLDKAMVMYNTIEDILRQLHSICSAEHWHSQETYMCKFGIGMVYAGVKLFKSAEEYVLHAMRMLIHTHTPISEPDKEKGKRQLLDMATCLIEKVYFAIPEFREYPGFLVTEQCTKAWHVCLTFILDDYVDMPAGHLDSCLQGLDMSSVTREAVLTIYGKKLSSRAGLASYCQLPADSVRAEKYRKGLDFLYKALVRLGQHELAVQMYQKVINEVDNVYACIPIDTALALFHPIRLVCVRRVLCYCDELITKTTTSELASSSAVNPQVVALLDFAFRSLTSLGDECDNGTGCELWGDLYRMRGYCCVALCLYAACFHSHGGSRNRHMKRLSNKINHLLDNREVREINFCPKLFVIFLILIL
ncbi:hypothetical protein EON65_54550 [archaeon]|nr:MAG: hypothetical protein EON65_54550 [archaeon]